MYVSINVLETLESIQFCACRYFWGGVRTCDEPELAVWDLEII